MAAIKLEGVLPPVSTPFDEQGELDAEALRGNLARLGRFGLAGFVVLGSNGESVHLSEGEARRVMETARSATSEQRVLIAGVGRPSTRETLQWSRYAAAAGADATLVLPPSYFRNQMTPEVLVDYFREVADGSAIPVTLYNMPACTGIDLDVETVLRLAEHENIVGIKDSSGNMAKLGELCQCAPQGFAVLVGTAGALVPALVLGAAGGIVALANIAPQECLDMYWDVRHGDTAAARAVQLRLMRLNRAVTRGWGVPALKAAMDMLGLFGGPPRRPLPPLPQGEREALRRLLADAGIGPVDPTGGGGG
ncbi:MAG: dihydrodipicolinate synthase family protein [Candidatus Bipolaricaulaceae bacterium]